MISTYPLHCFNIVEMHFPDRVMWQFGMSQHILDYVDTCDELHDISRQGKQEENWLLIHRVYLNMWHARRDHIFVERHPTIDLDSYMRWYLPITCRFITPTSSRYTTCPRTRLIYEPHQLRQNQFIQFVVHLLRA